MHKLITEIRSEYAVAQCSCGWSLFHNAKRGQGSRLQYLKESYKRHLGDK